jgi:Kef-type K+ transport system membrane component KefB
MTIFHIAAIPAIFAGAALTATSIGITSKVLSELGQLRSKEGQIIVGAQVDLSVLNPSSSGSNGLLIAGFLILVAIVGKLVTGWFVFGQPGINRLAIGVGMIPRGEVGLVFAGIGAASGAIDKSLQVAIILMVISTTFLAPIFLRFAFGNSTQPPSEATND